MQSQINPFIQIAIYFFKNNLILIFLVTLRYCRGMGVLFLFIINVSILDSKTSVNENIEIWILDWTWRLLSLCTEATIINEHSFPETKEDTLCAGEGVLLWKPSFYTWSFSNVLWYLFFVLFDKNSQFRTEARRHSNDAIFPALLWYRTSRKFHQSSHTSETQFLTSPLGFKHNGNLIILCHFLNA